MHAFVAMLHADEDDRMLTQSIMDEMQQPVSIFFADDVEDLSGFTEEKGLPAVILVNNHDHLHRATETVRRLKENRSLAHIPVVVLGELTTPDYIRQYYRAGASTYITKPSTLEGTRKKIRLFFEYWLNVAEV